MRHMRDCTGLLKCKLCKRQFQNIVSFKNHLRFFHNIDERKSKQNQMLRIGEKTFECIDCKAFFLIKYSLIHHMKRFCSKLRFKCDYCSQKFFRESDKIDHHRRVHLTLLGTSHSQNFICHICKTNMPAHTALTHLAEQHQRKTKFTFNICRLELPK